MDQLGGLLKPVGAVERRTDGLPSLPYKKASAGRASKTGIGRGHRAWPLESIVRLTLGMALLGREAGHKQSGGAGPSRLAEALFSVGGILRA